MEQMPIRVEEEHLKRRVLWAAFAVFVAAMMVGYIGEKSSYSTSLVSRQELLKETGGIWFALKPMMQNQEETRTTPDVFADFSPDAGSPDYLALSLGLMKGYPDQTFRPEGPVKRGEGMCILSKVCRLIREKAGVKHDPVLRDPPYTDIAEGHWVYESAKELWSMAALWDSGNARLDPEGLLPCRELRRMTSAIIDYFSSDLLILEARKEFFQLSTKGAKTEIPMNGWVLSWDGQTWLNIPENGKINPPENWKSGKLSFSHPHFREVSVDAVKIDSDSFWYLRLKKTGGSADAESGVDYSARSPQWVRERLKEHLRALKDRRATPAKPTEELAQVNSPETATKTPEMVPMIDLAPSKAPPDQPPIYNEPTPPEHHDSALAMKKSEDPGEQPISPDDEASDETISREWEEVLRKDDRRQEKPASGNSETNTVVEPQMQIAAQNEWEKVSDKVSASELDIFPRAKKMPLWSKPTVSPLVGKAVDVKRKDVLSGNPPTLDIPHSRLDRFPRIGSHPEKPAPSGDDASEGPANFELTGKVLDAVSRQGLGNATVLAGKRNITVGSDGSFSLTCSRDQMVELTAYCEGFETQVLKHRVGFRPGGLVLTLSPSIARFSGTVIDSRTGKGIANAFIKIGKVTALTKGNGSFVFPKIQPTYHQISCRADGYMEATEIAYVANPETKKVIKLLPLETSSGGSLGDDEEVPAE